MMRKIELFSLFILLNLVIPCLTGSNLVASGSNMRLQAGSVLTFTLSDYNGFNVSCNGAADGSIDLTPTGTPPFTYQWSNGAITEDLTGLTAGTYTVTVTDNLGATETSSVTLSEPTLISVTLNSVQNVSCNGGNNGAVNINVSGGAGSYTYLWSNGSSAQNLSSVTEGTYTVTVTDINGCTSQLTQVVTSPAPLIVNLVSVQNVLCFGNNTGAINISPSGGTAGYNYLWSNGSGSQNLNSVTAGTYTVTVTDANNCTAQLTQTITQPAQALSATTSSTPQGCNVSNGTATANPAGGTPGYSYLWSNGGNTSVITGLSAGTYTVTITDLNNCTFSTTAQVNTASAPIISSAAVTNVNCSGASTGAIDITLSGGTGTLSYVWSSGQITEDISGLPANTYTVTVSDQVNCTVTGSYTVTSAAPITISFSSTQPGCLASNGSITANPSGGTPGYSYLWSNGQNTATINNLSAGVYTVTVTDAFNCTQSNSFNLNPAAAPVITLNSITPVTCNGGTNGAIDISVSGGTIPLLFLWSNGAITTDLSGVAAGTYTVTVTDALLCSATATYTINQPAPFAVTPAVTPASCGFPNGTASVNISGDTPPYTYLWSTGSTNSAISGLSAGNYTVTVTGNLGCTTSQTLTVNSGAALSVIIDSVKAADCSPANTGAIYITPSGSSAPYQYLWNDGSLQQDRTSLVAGTYTVTVTGNDGCTGTASATVNAATPVLLSFNTTSASCNQSNGASTVIATGGTAPYSYLWSNGSNTSAISNVAAGIYTVTVTSNTGGCTATDTTVVLNDGAPVITLNSLDYPACDGTPNGSIKINVSGGQNPYDYLWSNGETNANNNNIGFGIYTVTVTDDNGCSTIATYDLGTQLQVQVQSIQNNSCSGSNTGAINITVTGGVPAYSYLWSNGVTTQNISGLPDGTYTVTVTAQNSCTAQVSGTVNSLPPIVIQGTVTDVSCNGNNGAIQLNVSGGAGPYTYLWSNGATTADISGLAANTYTVTVTDNAGCTAQNSFTVNSASTLTAFFQLLQGVSCAGASDASLEIIASGGSPGYTYLWNNGNTTTTITSVPAGIYTVTVSDNSGCQSIFTDTIHEPLPLHFTYSLTDPSCGLSNGLISVQATGGTQPFNYSWSNGTSASTLSAIPAGTYTVTISDANFCNADTVFTLVNTGQIQIGSVVDSISCNAANDGAIDLTITGGASPFQFVWVNTPQTTEDVTGLGPGNYSVIVTDNSGCTASTSFTLSEPAPIVINFPLLQNAACGNSNGGIIANATGSFAPFTYLWSTGAQTFSLFNIAAGSYTVTVTDAKGCTHSSVANISNNTGPVFASIDSGMVSCYGGNNGFINISVTGAAPPFSYSWTGSSATTPSINNLIAGVYTLQVTDAQNCISVRSVTITQPDSIRINPVVPQQNPPYNISCFGLNDGQIFLSVNGGVAPYTYLWSNGATTQNIDSLVAGVYTIVITDQNGCTAQQTFNLTQPPQLIANAGPDVTICGTDNYVMLATPPPAGFGYWTAITYPGINTFSDSTSSNTTVFNLQEGDNVFLWTVTVGSCSSAVQVTITRGTSVTANAGTDLTICESTVTLNATNPQFGFGFWRTNSSGVIIDDITQAVTQANNLLLGNNIFLWTVVSGNCRDSAEINIFRKDSLDCLSVIRMPTAFSPNSDGYNDVYIIKGLTDFPDNNLTIFNRWGVLVYETDNYQNNWDGTGTNNAPVNDGTYFVVLRVRSIDKVYTSYLDLRR